jgi:hypothetical protein
VPFEFDEGLRVDFGGSLTLNDAQGQTFSRFVDLLHTVRIVGTQVLDSQGNPISGATITSESGFNYNDPLGGAPVPEPGTVAFVAVGVASLIVKRWVKRERPAGFQRRQEGVAT